MNDKTMKLEDVNKLLQKKDERIKELELASDELKWERARVKELEKALEFYADVVAKLLGKH